MKNIFYILFFGGVLALAAGLYVKNRPQEHRIPDLLERKGALAISASWQNTRQAVEGLKTKIRRNPDDQASRLLLAYAYMQEARVTGEHPYYYPAALELIEEVLDNTPEKDPLYAKALIAQASVQLSQHRFGDALETGQQAIGLGSDDKDLYCVLTDANVELGHYDEAIRMADKAVSIRPELGTYSRISYLREIHGNMPGAVDAMKMAVESGYPGLEQTCWVRYQLGKLYERNGDTANARVQYSMALLEDARYGFAMGGLASLAEKANNPEKALQLYQKALDILPEFSFQEAIARIYLKTGQKGQARVAAEKTIAMLEEDKASGHVADLELANAYYFLTDDLDQALDYAEEEYDRRPDNIDVNHTLALIYQKIGNEEKARRHAQLALRTGKKDEALLGIMQKQAVASR